MRVAKLCTLSCLILAASCSSQPSNVYDVPVDVAFERLISRDLHDFRIARQCGILIHFKKQALTNQRVKWSVTSSGKQVASFTVLLTPYSDDQTQIDIEIPQAPDGGEIYDGTKFYPRPALHQPLRDGVEELVSARLEQREFDVMRIPPSEENRVCRIQRGALESGHNFKVDDYERNDDVADDWGSQ
ncbi:MAG: hypothetical protein AAF687_07465 [Pseudomonadota bacterium]